VRSSERRTATAKELFPRNSDLLVVFRGLDVVTMRRIMIEADAVGPVIVVEPYLVRDRAAEATSSRCAQGRSAAGVIVFERSAELAAR
jgi:hypothetical protein